MAYRPLSDFGPGDVIRLLPPADVDASCLHELAALRLLPGEVVTVVQAGRRGAPILVQSGAGLYAVGGRLAGTLTGEPVRRA